MSTATTEGREIPRLKTKYREEIVAAMQSEFSYANIMQQYYQAAAHTFDSIAKVPYLSSAAGLGELCPDWRQRAAYACGPEEFLDDAEALWSSEAAAHKKAGPFAADPINLIIERFNTSLVG